jgi:hypothetical protein
MYSLIGTAKLNGIEPESYLRNVLSRIASTPVRLKGERGDAVFNVRVRRGREIPMLGLHLDALKRHVKPGLDDVALRTEYAIAHGDEPGCVASSAKPLIALWMHFYIPARGGEFG